jgi:hypothetical protein
MLSGCRRHTADSRVLTPADGDPGGSASLGVQRRCRRKPAPARRLVRACFMLTSRRGDDRQRRGTRDWQRRAGAASRAAPQQNSCSGAPAVCGTGWAPQPPEGRIKISAVHQAVPVNALFAATGRTSREMSRCEAGPVRQPGLVAWRCRWREREREAAVEDDVNARRAGDTRDGDVCEGERRSDARGAGGACARSASPLGREASLFRGAARGGVSLEKGRSRRRAAARPRYPTSHSRQDPHSRMPKHAGRRPSVLVQAAGTLRQEGCDGVCGAAGRVGRQARGARAAGAQPAPGNSGVAEPRSCRHRHGHAAP